MQLTMKPIYSPRLYLRAMRASDALDLHELFSDPRITDSLLMSRKVHLDETRSFLRIAYLSHVQQGIPEAMVVCLRENGKVIGIVNIHTIKHEDIGELGFMMHADYQNQGYMSEAVKAFIECVFHTLELRRLEVMHEEHNLASQRVIEHCGFVYEGRLRAYYVKEGKPLNMKLYSLLKVEYRKEQKDEERTRNPL
ncbi:MAG: GNAT family N-acetyltransferase [Erysipelotrichaceae bacterium]